MHKPKSKTYSLFFIEVHRLARLCTSAYLKLRQDLHPNFPRGQLANLLTSACLKLRKNLHPNFHRSPSISKSVHFLISKLRQGLQAIFHERSSISKCVTPMHESKSGKTYTLIFIEGHWLTQLCTSAYLKVRQYLHPNSHRSPSISKSVHFRISQTQEKLTV